MASAGDNHGGNGKQAKDCKTMQEKYVEARVSGVPPRKAATQAGYSPGSKIHSIERPGGPVHALIIKAMEDKGITPDWLAGEYVDGIGRAKKIGAKELDLNAHAQYLRQIGYLLTGGKPQLAVQINNNAPATPSDDPERIRELLREVAESTRSLSECLKMVKEEIGRRKPSGLRGGSPDVAGGGGVLAEAEPCEGVDAPGGGAQETAGGGGA